MSGGKHTVLERGDGHLDRRRRVQVHAQGQVAHLVGVGVRRQHALHGRLVACVVVWQTSQSCFQVLGGGLALTRGDARPDLVLLGLGHRHDGLGGPRAQERRLQAANPAVRAAPLARGDRSKSGGTCLRLCMKCCSTLRSFSQGSSCWLVSLRFLSHLPSSKAAPGRPGSPESAP